MYLIDTDIVIYNLKGHAGVTDAFARHRSVPKMLSVITYGELVYGARKSQHIEKNLATARRVGEIYPLLPATTAVMETLAGLKASLEKEGTTLDDMDTLIAATALTHNLVLVTNNDNHFRRVDGLEVENWAG